MIEGTGEAFLFSLSLRNASVMHFCPSKPFRTLYSSKPENNFSPGLYTKIEVI